jgi:hypothetical protein
VERPEEDGQPAELSTYERDWVAPWMLAGCRESFDLDCWVLGRKLAGRGSAWMDSDA